MTENHFTRSYTMNSGTSDFRSVLPFTSNEAERYIPSSFDGFIPFPEDRYTAETSTVSYLPAVFPDFWAADLDIAIPDDDYNPERIVAEELESVTTRLSAHDQITDRYDVHQDREEFGFKGEAVTVSIHRATVERGVNDWMEAEAHLSPLAAGTTIDVAGKGFTPWDIGKQLEQEFAATAFLTAARINPAYTREKMYTKSFVDRVHTVRSMCETGEAVEERIAEHLPDLYREYRRAEFNDSFNFWRTASLHDVVTGILSSSVETPRGDAV